MHGDVRGVPIYMLQGIVDCFPAFMFAAGDDLHVEEAELVAPAKAKVIKLIGIDGENHLADFIAMHK